MALFGKADGLADAVKRLEDGGPPGPAELETLLETVRTHPDFRIDRTVWMLRSPNRRIREFAEEQLLQRPDATALASRLVKEVVAADPSLRAEAAQIAHRVAGDRLHRFLPLLIHAGLPERRDAALEIMAASPEVRSFLPFLKVALHDPVPDLRRKAVRILAGAVANPSVFVLLRDLIHDEDAEVRRVIIEAFAQHPGPDIVEPFFERLALEGEQERGVILGALSQLARTAQGEIEDRVLPMLSDECASVREMAVRLLSEMPDRTRLLRAFLVHCRGLVFWLRDRSLASIRTISGSLVEPLLELMRADEEEDVRVGAMLLVCGAQDPRVRALVGEIFTGTHDWWVRSTAAEVLNGFPGEEITRLLISRIDDPDLRFGIISLLGSRHDPEATAALLACLHDPSRVMRRVAVSALARRGGTEARMVLMQVAAEDPDLTVREQAAGLLESGPRPLPAAGACEGGADLTLCMENEELNAPASPGAGDP